MADFRQMGGVPDFYAQLMQSANSGLVRMPDGSYVAAPQMGGPTSPEQIYAGMGLAPPNLPLNPAMPPRPSNSWPGGSDAVGAGPGSFGNMQGFAFDPSYGGQGLPPSNLGREMPTTQEAQAEQGFMRTVPQAGNVQMPPGVRPESVDQAFGQMFGDAPTSQTAFAPQPRNRPMFPPPMMQTAMVGPDGYTNDDKDPARLMSGTGLAFSGEEQTPPALAAIEGAAGMPPLPRPRPNLPPIPRPRPLGRASAPAMPSGGSYTVKKGDTAWDLSRSMGMSLDQFVAATGLRDPSKLMVGQKLSFGGDAPSLPSPPPARPQQRSNGNSRPPSVPSKPAGFGSRGYTPTNDQWLLSVTGRG